MKKTALFFVLLTITLTAPMGGNVFAYDQYNLLQQGHIARNSGNREDAIQNYQAYINSHPFSQNIKSTRAALLGATSIPANNNQYLLRNLLIAYENLLDTLRENGGKEDLTNWLTKLQSTYQPEKYGSKNAYNLARILEKNNDQTSCILLLEKIVTRQIEEYHPRNNKVLLRAASKLIKLYDQQGKTEQRLILYKNLQQCPQYEFDNRDILKLATLFLKSTQTKRKGERLLAQIAGQSADDPAMNKATFLQANIKLMKYRFQRHDNDGLDAIVKRCIMAINDNVSPGSSYKLAVAFLKYDKKKEGKKILNEISTQYPNTIWARKSLFLLGRAALSEKDWNGAILHYSTYIARYPEQRFFCLKAYSNILDAYWSRDGDLEKQQVQIDRFADIINQTADYEMQLNMARELSYKGFAQLADSTFILGYTYAQDTIANNQNSLPAMRVNWQLTKYGFEVGRYSIARESGELVLEQYTLLYDLLEIPKEKERARHYLSRTILWLAKLYEANDEVHKAQEILLRFLADFPHDTDIDYAEYQLARLYEQERQFPKAIELYQKVEHPQWRNKANKALHRLGNI